MDRKQEFGGAAANRAGMTKNMLTRRELARQVAGGVGALLAMLALPARSQVVDPAPATVPPPLPSPTPAQKAPAMIPNATASEGDLLTQLVPVAAGYTLSDTQAKEAALQLKDYPGSFAKARVYALPDDVGPAFAADVPPRRKEREK